MTTTVAQPKMKGLKVPKKETGKKKTDVKGKMAPKPGGLNGVKKGAVKKASVEAKAPKASRAMKEEEEEEAGKEEWSESESEDDVEEAEPESEQDGDVEDEDDGGEEDGGEERPRKRRRKAKVPSKKALKTYTKGIKQISAAQIAEDKLPDAKIQRMIKKAPFNRICREIAAKFGNGNVRLKAEALKVLHEEAENFMVGINSLAEGLANPNVMVKYERIMREQGKEEAEQFLTDAKKNIFDYKRPSKMMFRAAANLAGGPTSMASVFNGGTVRLENLYKPPNGDFVQTFRQNPDNLEDPSNRPLTFKKFNKKPVTTDKKTLKTPPAETVSIPNGSAPVKKEAAKSEGADKNAVFKTGGPPASKPSLMSSLGIFTSS